RRRSSAGSAARRRAAVRACWGKTPCSGGGTAAAETPTRATPTSFNFTPFHQPRHLVTRRTRMPQQKRAERRRARDAQRLIEQPRSRQQRRHAPAPADPLSEHPAVLLAILILGTPIGQRADDVRRGYDRRLNRHGHAVAGQWIDDARGVADHEDASLDRGARAEDHRLAGEEVLLRRLERRV